MLKDEIKKKLIRKREKEVELTEFIHQIRGSCHKTEITT
jgi:hypothetical protein